MVVAFFMPASVVS